MHRRSVWFSFLVLLGVVPALTSLLADEQNASGPGVTEPVFHVREPESSVRLTARSSKVIQHSARIKAVDGHDPKVVDIQALSPTQIRIHGLEGGVTDLVLTDENDRRWHVEIFVVGNVRHLQSLLRHLYPHSSIEVIEIKGSVLLRGWVTQPEHINQAIEIAETFYESVLNHMQVGGVQQVLLQCQILEVQRSKLRRLGMNFAVNGQNGYLVSTPGPITPVESLEVGTGGATIELSGFGDATISFGVFNSNRIFQGFIRALRDEGLLKLSSQPSVVTTNGAPANILSGGEVPIVVPAGLGTVGIEFRSFGISLNAVPIILGNGRVRLKLRPEVSERDFSSSVTVQGVSVPGFTVRRADTQIEMNFGETLAIGGLISQRETATAQKVPLFGELPVIGAAFSNKVSEMSETELVILITPQYVDAMKPGQVPPGGPGQFTDTPTDHELYWHNLLEVPKYGDACEGCPNGVFPISGRSGICSCPTCRSGGNCGRRFRWGKDDDCGCSGCASGEGCVNGGGPCVPSGTPATTAPAGGASGGAASGGAQNTPQPPAPGGTDAGMTRLPQGNAAPRAGSLDGSVPVSEDGLPGLIEPGSASR